MRGYIPKLTIRCTVGYINNFATSECKTSAEISFENPSGNVSVENIRVDPRSEHTFIINNATSLGLKGNYNLTKEQATKIFLLSCSLLMQRYYLSPIQAVQLSSEVEYVADIMHENVSEDQIPHCTIIVSAGGSCCLLNKIKIDETTVFQTAKKVLCYNIFNPQNRTLDENNVIEAIESYQEALTATEYSSCYKSLYPALEKAVNSDKTRVGDEFDIAASNLTGIKKDGIKELRIFYNRLKHRLKNNSTDLKALNDGQAKIQSLLLDLKEATDTAILAKLC